MFGWTGKILHIDLSRQSFQAETPDPGFYRRFIGGKGLGGFYLRQCCTLDWDHEDMVVCIFAGPVTGTAAPTSGRTHIVSKSPLTGLIADSSVGGKLGKNLKQAGWDGIVITGKAGAPAGIVIDNQIAEIKDAREYIGLSTDAVHKKINPGKASLASIGPAAENGVKFASLMVDRHHAAGRCGLGLCFAEKNIKYLLVSGTGRYGIHDASKLKTARQDILRLTSASPAVMGEFGFSRLGTAAVFDLIDSRRMMPTDNFNATHFSHASQVNAFAYSKQYEQKKQGCSNCHILCKKTGKKGSRTFTMPEFETMSHFSALIGCHDIDLVVKANELCNFYGMDTISAGSALACRREITGRDYTGQAQILSLLEDIGKAMNEGRDLRMGASFYALKMNRPEAAMSVKKLELPAYDPRGAFGMALSYALSTRGGCHLRAYPISHEIFRKPVATDRFSFSGKARIIKIAEDLNAVIDSLVACKFLFFAAGIEEYAQVFEAVTGVETSGQDLLESGERIYYNERIINALNGFDAEDDDLPDRFFNSPGTHGDKIEIAPLDRNDFIQARSRYYKIRGLDTNGLPLKDKADSLGLIWNSL